MAAEKTSRARREKWKTRGKSDFLPKSCVFSTPAFPCQAVWWKNQSEWLGNQVYCTGWSKAGDVTPCSILWKKVFLVPTYSRFYSIMWDKKLPHMLSALRTGLSPCSIILWPWQTAHLYHGETGQLSGELGVHDLLGPAFPIMSWDTAWSLGCTISAPACSKCWTQCVFPLFFHASSSPGHTFLNSSLF